MKRAIKFVEHIAHILEVDQLRNLDDGDLQATLTQTRRWLVMADDKPQWLQGIMEGRAATCKSELDWRLVAQKRGGPTVDKRDWSDRIAAVKLSKGIAEVIALSGVDIKRSGQVYSGRCPFHDDRTPSLKCWPESGRWKCLAGATRIMTWNGSRSISDLVGSTHKVLTLGGVWVDVPFKHYGQATIWEVVVSRNRSKRTILATGDHRWIIRGQKTANGQWIKASDKVTTALVRGDRLGYAYPHNQVGVGVPSSFGVAHGFVFGDGTRQKSSVAYFCGEKDQSMIRYFPDSTLRNRAGGQSIGGLPLFFKDRPSIDESASYLYGWLAGYFAADGCVSDDGQVSLSSANRENIEFAQTVANRLGMGVYGIRMQMRLGRGKVVTPLYHMTFIGSTIRPDFFCLNKHRERFVELVDDADRQERKGWVVEGIRKTDAIDDVFCAEVSGTHSFCLEDNLLTGNCYGCDLGGDALDYVMQWKGVDLGSALEFLEGRGT